MKQALLQATQAPVPAPRITPLEFMESVLADGSLPIDIRLEAAKAAAPYRHKRMPQAVEQTIQQAIEVRVEFVG